MDGPTTVIPPPERQQDRHNHLFIPTPKLSKVFGRSTSQTGSQTASWDNLSSSITSAFILSSPRSPTSSISKSGRRKSQRVVSPQVVSSILDGMYAYPVNRDRESNRLSPPKYQNRTSLHHKSSLGTVTSRISGMSRQSSESPFHQPPTPVIKTNHRTPGHSSNEDFPSTNFEPETSNTRPMAMKPETQSKNLADSGSTVRIVGRGGSGSRLRVVTPTPESLELNPPLHREPPASLSRSYHGAGGSRSAQKPVGPAPALLSILRRRKQGPSSKGKERDYAHSPPLSPNLSYQASNGSGSTVSTIQFVCDPGVPRPAPFPLAESIEHSSSDKISLPLSSSTSTFDSTVEDSSLDTRMSSIDDFDLDLYLEDALCPPPEERRKKSLNKLARTLGDLPPPNAPRDIFPDEQPGKQESIPRHFIEEDPTKKDPPKVLRRASLALSTVSSVFGRPSGRRRRGSIKSYHSLSTLTDDLHQLNLADDFSDSSSACNSPGSPILFSPPSPSAVVHPPNPTTPNPFGVEVEQDFLSVSSPSLSRSHSYSHGPRRRSEWLSNHSHSASTSLSYIDPSTISSSPAWIFPPSDAREEATFSIPSSPEEQQTWTGEWNSDIDDVIRALRALR